MYYIIRYIFNSGPNLGFRWRCWLYIYCSYHKLINILQWASASLRYPIQNKLCSILVVIPISVFRYFLSTTDTWMNTLSSSSSLLSISLYFSSSSSLPAHKSTEELFLFYYKIGGVIWDGGNNRSWDAYHLGVYPWDTLGIVFWVFPCEENWGEFGVVF